MVVAVEVALLGGAIVAALICAPVSALGGLFLGGAALSWFDEWDVPAHALRVMGGRHPGDEDRTVGDALHAAWILAITVGAGLIAYLGMQDRLGGVGLAFAPTMIPFVLAALAAPSIARRWQLDGAGSSPRIR